jgi:hypothetical protein
MKEMTYNQWQAHLANELKKNYIKLKLIKPDERNIRAVSGKKS